MKIYILSKSNSSFKNELLYHLKNNSYDYHEYVNHDSIPFYRSVYNFSKLINNEKGCLGIIIDDYPCTSYNIANKVENMICAPVSDEHSSHMTREHNGTKVIILSEKIIGIDLAKSIAIKFLNEDYVGGRHQIRLDMMSQIDCGGK